MSAICDWIDEAVSAKVVVDGLAALVMTTFLFFPFFPLLILHLIARVGILALEHGIKAHIQGATRERTRIVIAAPRKASTSSHCLCWHNHVACPARRREENWYKPHARCLVKFAFLPLRRVSLSTLYGLHQSSNTNRRTFDLRTFTRVHIITCTARNRITANLSIR